LIAILHRIVLLKICFYYENKLLIYICCFLMLCLYWICLSVFLVAYVQLFVHKTMFSKNNDSFTSFFLLFGCIFLSFCFLIAQVRTSDPMLNRSFESRHPCFPLDFWGKGSNFPPWVNVSCGLVLYIPCAF
jgi:hypothetical protein